VALRETTAKESAVYYLVGDHLGSSSVTTDSDGIKKAELRYKPWGELRYAWGDPNTDRRFTGQRNDGVGLYFYQSRWLDPSIAQFNQPDTLIPDPYNPLDWNRYTYGRSNPVYYIDPDGHCPIPSESSGNVICIDLFIQSRTIGLGFGYGDNRGFDANSDPSASRAYAYLYMGEDGRLKDVQVYVNPSCTAAGCYGPYEEYNSFIAVQDPDTGEIQISWNLLNGFSGMLREHADEVYERESSIGAMPLYSNIVLGASSGLAAINGEMTIAVSSTSYKVTSMDRDPYPSLEVYHFQNGIHKATLWQSKERYGPFIGLSPIAPNERFHVNAR
jgi:RHS repeat-associated protein